MQVRWDVQVVVEKGERGLECELLQKTPQRTSHFKIASGYSKFHEKALFEHLFVCLKGWIHNIYYITDFPLIIQMKVIKIIQMKQKTI